WSEQLQWYERALRAAQTLNRREEASFLRYIGKVYYLQGELGAAHEWLTKALARVRSEGSRAGEGAVLSYLGMVHLQQGDTAAAQACHEQALAIAREQDNRAGEA